MAEHLLLFDIGNTSMKAGVALSADPGPDSSPLVATYSLPTDLGHTVDSLGLTLMELCRHAGVAPEKVAACVAASVVPALERVLRGACERYFGARLLLAPDDVPVPLENRYERPAEVGADRLVTAWAGKRLTGAENCIVVDFGTATTFDCVRGDAYLGGLICPGVLSSARALSSRTAKLPQVTLEVDPDRVEVGRSTADSLNQGLVFGFAAMAEGLVRRLAPEVGPDPAVVATGGFAEHIAPVAPLLAHVAPNLLLEGLFLLYRMWAEQAAR